jgi:hypothetical protein
VAQEVHTDDGELNIRQQKGPMETAAVEQQVHGLAAPAGNRLAVGTGEARAAGLTRRVVWENTKRSASIY